MALVEVARFADLTEAQVAASALRASGIFVFLQNQHHGEMNFGVQFALGGFPLHVMEEEAAEVRAMLSHIRAAPSSLAPPPPAQSVPRLAFSLVITWLFGVPTPLPIQREHQDEGRVPISSP
jgi:hypothetical protein